MDENENIVVNTDEIERFLFKELTKRGFVPSSKELIEISDILFDYLIYKEIVKEDN